MDPTSIIVIVLVTGVLLVLQRVSSLSARLDRLSRMEGKVDALLRHEGIQYDPLGDVPLPVREALEQGERILAIKRLREATGIGLKEAKELVDELGLQPASATWRLLGKSETLRSNIARSRRAACMC